jgi:hypothetical protein
MHFSLFPFSFFPELQLITERDIVVARGFYSICSESKDFVERVYCEL